MNYLEDDLTNILKSTEQLWKELQGQKLFITGGTGLFGSWLLESFSQANNQYKLNAQALVLSRNPQIFKQKLPHLAHDPAIEFIQGDVKNFEFPQGEFSYIIHAAATSATETFNNEDPLKKFETVVQGTKHVLEFAVKTKAKKILYTSSGAVYGKQPAELSHLAEEYNGTPDSTDIESSWSLSKRVAEFLCAYYSKKYNIEIKIARCFSFVGPYLPLNIHYAIGNFLRDGLTGGPIKVTGDGTPERSYLYMSDLTVWLWTILFKGQSMHPYNVGSETGVTIKALAENVAKEFDNLKVEVAKQPLMDKIIDRYVPSTKRAQTQLGLKQTIKLSAAINKTAKHIQNNKRLYFN